MKLHELLSSRFADWRDDIPASWKSVFTGVEPDAAGVPQTVGIGPTIRLFPNLKGDPDPKAAPGSAALRAIERVKFKKVRVVLMGQDPYPRVRQATGRAFEPGDWKSWNHAVPRSFMRIIQRLVEFRTGDPSFIASDGAWNSVKQAVSNGTIDLDSPKDLYDHWEDQGVIFLNAVLTYTLPKHVIPCHGVFWKPVVHAIMQKLAERSSGVVVFAAWGAECENVFKKAKIKATAEASGKWDNTVTMVKHSHPAAHLGAGGKPGFFTKGNPFLAINDALTGLGVPGTKLIDW